MRDPRNPFRLRRAENIDTDTSFLSLFEPGVLEALAETGLPESVQLIRSAAGGGKTSLLRLFTPSVLTRLHARKFEEQELFARLRALEAVDERGPVLLGVLLLCGRNYAGLEDLRLDGAQSTRLFLGLLNARILLAVLRSALALRGLEYPQDLGRVSVQGASDFADSPAGILFPASGSHLYDWARGVERAICGALDSFGPMGGTSLPGSDSLFVLEILKAKRLLIDGTQVAERIVVMMDDIHMLTAPQRELLIQRVVEARSGVGVWIAERFEALSTKELLSSGSTVGRDHVASLALEGYWRPRHDRFEKHALRIADKRVKASVETELDGFRSCIQDGLDGEEYDAIFEKAALAIGSRLRAEVGRNLLFREWIEERESSGGSPRERAMGWRALEILVERILRKPQRGLFDLETPLSPKLLTEQSDSSVRHAAELFLSREFDLPYYFGPDRLSRLASLNIEQFLGLSGSIFEEVIAGELIRGGSTTVSARRQHILMKKAAQVFWNEIPVRVRHGRHVRSFLESVGRFCEWYTYRPSAPNDPGVGGTAIRMSERNLLMEEASLRGRPDRERLADILGSALAHNYLVADLDYKCKGEWWMVLNLNRLLCVQFNLPLGYGLYKERPLEELCRWLEFPFEVPRQEELLT